MKQRWRIVFVFGLLCHAFIVWKKGSEGLKLLLLLQQLPIDNEGGIKAVDEHPPGKNWTHKWLEQGTGGGPARMLFVHVGKTGGVTLIKSIPIDKKAKQLAVRCAMEAQLNNTDNDNNTGALRAMNSSENMKNSNNNRSSFSFGTAWKQCYDLKKDGQSRLARHTISHRHMWGGGLSPDELNWVLFHSNTFLVSVRNPLSRIVSAFNFHQHNNIARNDRANATNSVFFRTCFPSIDKLAEHLLNDTSTTVPDFEPYPREANSEEFALKIIKGKHVIDSCVSLAKITLRGMGQYDWLEQFRFNYKFYKSEILDQRPELAVVAVRTEHLWDDVLRLEKALGGDGQHFKRPQGHNTHGSETYAVQTAISTAAGKQAICCQIYQDMDAFQSIILAAMNLNHTEKVDTLQAPMRDCGILHYTRDIVDEPFPWHLWYNQTCVPARRLRLSRKT